jgi:hypothetical protein
MKISEYLAKIESKTPVNFTVFARLLEAEGFSYEKVLSIFSVTKINKTRYDVAIKNDQVFSELQIKFPKQYVLDRVSAANAGNSHRHPVSKSMLIVWSYQSDHPVVILNSADFISTPVTPSHNLLIVENQENFVQKENTLDFLIKEIPEFSDEHLDVVFASGNAITNKLNKTFFNHYSRIDCLLDLDIGGLEIFQSLDKLTQHPKLNFLVPACAEKLLLESKNNLEEQHLPRLRKLAASCPKLEQPFKLIAKTRKLLEQEIYLRE